MGIPISDSELRDLLLQYRSENWEGIQPPNVQRRVVEEIMRGGADGPLRVIERYVALRSGARILDLGSGVGSFVAACRSRGFQAFGLEPDKIGQGAKVTSIGIARRRLAESVFANGVGEDLPFRDECFDVVVMNQVIEHVVDQRKVIHEAARVVRRGGAIYLACPNYLRFYEPHYKIFWLPLLPKFVGKLYLRLRGRSPAMLDQLTYTTNARVRKLLRSLSEDFVVVDIHREKFLAKRGAGSFAARSTRLVAGLTKLPVIGRVFLGIVLQYASLAAGGCEIVVLRKAKAART